MAFLLFQTYFFFTVFTFTALKGLTSASIHKLLEFKKSYTLAFHLCKNLWKILLSHCYYSHSHQCYCQYK